jgi:hypothetical protein
MADEQVIDGQAAGEAPVEESASSIYPDLTPEAQAEKPEPAPGDTPETPEKPGSEPAGELGDKGKEEIITLRKRAQEAERRAAYLEGLAEGRIKPEQQPEVRHELQPLIRPNTEDFDTQQAYEDALLSWNRETIKRELAAANDEQVTRQRYDEIYGTYRQRMDAAAADNPELKAIETRPDLPISPTMAQLIHQSEMPDKLTLYFADHPDEAMRLFKTAEPLLDARGNVVGVRGNPILVAREMGRLEAKLAAEPAVKPKEVTGAPEPHEPVGGGKGVINAADAFDPNLSTDERIALWKGKGQ